MLAIIDGDEILYKIALSYQKTQYFVKCGDVRLNNVRDKESGISDIVEYSELDIDSEIITYPFQNVDDRIDMAISSILLNTKSTSYKIAISGSDNFRYKVATLLPYKGNRDKSNPPIYLKETREFFKRNYKYVMNENNEADEMLVSEAKKCTGKWVICSSDKDLRTFPGIHYHIMHRSMEYVSKDKARYNFFYQLLVGDPTDNIPHPYLLGEVKAKAFLDTLDFNLSDAELYQQVREFYIPFLEAKNKDGEYKTKWYKGQDVDEVLEEVGNLLYMEHEPGGESKWKRFT